MRGANPKTPVWLNYERPCEPKVGVVDDYYIVELRSRFCRFRCSAVYVCVIIIVGSASRNHIEIPSGGYYSRYIERGLSIAENII